ncbi:MAG: NAD(P)/FAD-dependent oxidoreductase [Gammaproteobacteria bacterium]|nr:NAD(P)/FAD-dependent oxidoreductase [Gammaproteobacteria bacterium]
MRHVIIGAGPAGVVAAETLRRLDRDAGVLLIGDEPEPPYSRMALPYYLMGQIGEPGTHLRKGADHYARLGIELRRARVARVHAGAHRLDLEGGGTVDYDRLLIATGSRPVKPPVPGIDSPGVYNCWTLADGRAIAARMRAGSRVVLMGAGFIGCIILEALAASGADLTVVEMLDRMVPRMMNDKAGTLIKQWCQSKGVAVHTATKVTAIAPAAGALAVTLDSGAVLEADLVVSATGVKPNLELLAGSGIETDQGVLIDRHLRSSDADVFAAGDVAQGRDFSTGERSVQAIQPTAVEHGQIAARNMVGQEVEHRGSVNMNVLDTLGLVSSSFGLWMGVDGGEQAELYSPDRYRYLNLQFDGDVLVGATSLGLTQHVGVLRGLIQTRTRLGPWRHRLQADPSRIMEAYLGATQAIGFNARLM